MLMPQGGTFSVSFTARIVGPPGFLAPTPPEPDDAPELIVRWACLKPTEMPDRFSAGSEGWLMQQLGRRHGGLQRDMYRVPYL